MKIRNPFMRTRQEVPRAVQDSQLSGNHYFYNPSGEPPVRLTPQAVINALDIRGQNRAANNSHVERVTMGGDGY